MEQERDELGDTMDWEPSENEVDHDQSEEDLSESEEGEETDDFYGVDDDSESEEDIVEDQGITEDDYRYYDEYICAKYGYDEYQFYHLEKNDPYNMDHPFSIGSTDEDYLKRFGSAIAKSSYLKGVYIGIKDDEITPDAIESIRKGFGENKSIDEIWIDGGDFFNGAIFQALLQPSEYHLCKNAADESPPPYLSTTNHRMRKLTLSNMTVNDKAMKNLSSALAGHMVLNGLTFKEMTGITNEGWKLFSNSLKSPHMSLRQLEIDECPIGDEMMVLFSGGISQNKSLHELTLSSSGQLVSDVGWAGFGYALSKSNVEDLYLLRLNLDGNKMSALTSGLGSSKKLKKLCLLWNKSISGRGISELSNVMFQEELLCNTSSIKSTFFSNHTLEEISGAFDFQRPGHVRQWLELNRNKDKKIVAVKKVFECHLSRNFNLQPFENIGTKLLADVLGWVGTPLANDAVDFATRHAAVYRLLKAFPEFFELRM